MLISFGGGALIGTLILSWFQLYGKGRLRGRIDIASGQVTATLETKPDGTTYWVFTDAD